MPDTPDLNSYYMTHAAMRRGSRQLAAAIAGLDPADRRRVAAVRWYVDGMFAELEQHHATEDDLFFPALAARIPTFAALDAGLQAEHGRLDQLMADLSHALHDLERGTEPDITHTFARVAAEELARLLDDHLAVEDADVLPLFERHFTATEYDVLDREAVKRIRLRDLLFTVPWAVTTAEPDAARHLLAHGPVLLRLVWQLTRRRYSRRASFALGTTVPAAVAR